MSGQSAIGIPVEQGFYTLTLGITPEGGKTMYFYDPSNEDMNGCVVYGVTIHESISDILATCKIEVEVPYTWVDSQYLTDGTKISIDMKINEQMAPGFSQYNEPAYVFRLFEIEKIEDHGVFVRLILGGIIDVLPIYGDANEFNCKCLTSNIFKKAGDKIGCTKQDIDDTKDKQLWIANGRSVYQFLNYCSQFGWVDNTSGMMWAIDRNKKLYYKNVDKLFKSGTAGSSGNCANGNCSGSQNIRIGSLGVPVVTSIPFGLNNIKLNTYGANADVFKVCEKESCKYDYVNIKSECVCKSSESTCVCKNGPKNQGQNWFPFDVGNHGENYFKAVYQNRQVLGTYSTFMSVRFTPSTGIIAKNSIIPFFQAFHLFDTHNIEYAVDMKDGKFTTMSALSTKAMIESIDINITQKHAATKIKFAAQGLNTKGKTN